MLISIYNQVLGAVLGMGNSSTTYNNFSNLISSPKNRIVFQCQVQQFEILVLELEIQFAAMSSFILILLLALNRATNAFDEDFLAPRSPTPDNNAKPCNLYKNSNPNGSPLSLCCAGFCMDWSPALMAIDSIVNVLPAPTECSCQAPNPIMPIATPGDGGNTQSPLTIVPIETKLIPRRTPPPVLANQASMADRKTNSTSEYVLHSILPVCRDLTYASALKPVGSETTSTYEAYNPKTDKAWSTLTGSRFNQGLPTSGARRRAQVFGIELW
jgi:hypothetical protein